MLKGGRSILAKCLSLKTLAFYREYKSNFENKSDTPSESKNINTEEKVDHTLDRFFSKKDEFSNTSMFNFIQGSIGNCGMVSAISLLANNKGLYEKVVPKGQNFDMKNDSKITFNLYKLGQLHKVIVDKKLEFEGNELKYCKSIDNNLIGPLLEKALVKLHFEGNYKTVDSVPASFVFSSLSNNFFEEFHFNGKESTDINKIISHGFRTNSQMVVSFNDDEAPKLSLKNRHYYSLCGIEKNKKDNLVLYNPHGEIVSIKKNEFFDVKKIFEICYAENKIFGMPVIKTLLEIRETWPLKDSNENIHYVQYNLVVTEDGTDILINLNVNNLDPDIKPIVLIVKHKKKMEVVTASLLSQVSKNKEWLYFKNSLKATLNKGTFRIVFVISKYDRITSCEQCKNYLKNGGNKFFFRIASSKHCSIEKLLTSESEKIEKLLTDFNERLL